MYLKIIQIGCTYLFNLCLLFYFTSSAAQTRTPIFYKIIQDDSAVLFVNTNYRFTEETCLAFTRRIRVNGSGDFNGYFEDRTPNNRLLGLGTYSNGVKHGYFEVYHPNGNVYCKGYYENNQPIGTWIFFYENGLPERTLNFTGTEMLLIRFIDPDVKIKIQDGNGKFSYSNVRGKVVDGKAHGKWVALSGGQPFYVEKYEHGKLIKKRGVLRGNPNPKDKTPILNNFFLDNYLPKLERFDFSFCKDSIGFKVGTIRMALLRSIVTSDLTETITRVVDNDLKLGNQNQYSFGESSLLIKFDVDENGKAGEFTLSPNSDENLKRVLLSEIKTIISRYPIQKRKKPYSLRVKFTYTGGSRFWFSLKLK